MSKYACFKNSNRLVLQILFTILITVILFNIKKAEGVSVFIFNTTKQGVNNVIK